MCAATTLELLPKETQSELSKVFDNKLVKVVLYGSTSTYAITQNIYRAYYKNYENHPAFPKAHSKTVASYKRLIDGEVEMIFVPDVGEEVLKYAEEKNVKLKFIPIADEAIIFFIGTKNKVYNITTEQLQDIYVNNGITNWKELSGDDGTLAAYCRNEDSGSHAPMEPIHIQQVIMQ